MPFYKEHLGGSTYNNKSYLCGFLTALYCTCCAEQSERKLDTIRQHSHVVSKKVHGCVQGSGATVDKHQVSLLVCLSLLPCVMEGVWMHVW